MTGGGSVFCPYLDTGGTQRVTHGFELHCKLDGLAVSEPNNLEINFSGGDNFHLTTLDSAVCSDDGAIIQQPPGAQFDTFVGTGTGTFNGSLAKIAFTLVDAGEPGTKDTAAFTITLVNGGAEVLSCPATALTFGNQQAHNATGSKP
jgi:hypothetical protein